MKFEQMQNKIIQGDCLEVMKKIPDNSIDLVLTDPPYGVTQNKDDIAVNLEELFRVAKGVIMTTQQPYTTDVIQQFKKYFKYDLVWDKILPTGFLNANRMPLRVHEIILVFGNINYYPQKVKGEKNHSKGKPKDNRNENYGKYSFVDNTEELGEMKHPKSIIQFKKPHPSIAQHRTEKSLELMEWLVKSYSNKNDLILDPFLGSGTTAVACKHLKRNFIGIEISEEYCKIARDRLRQEILI